MMRCEWVKDKPKICLDYHDKEWGVPIHDDDRLFELLILESAQAGLSWFIILKKRENYRRAFDNFNPKKVAKYSDKKYEELIKNAGIIRNRLKIKSAINNAKVFLEIQKEFGTFDNYIWGFTDYKQIKNKFISSKEVPTRTYLSDKISKDLKKRGMTFIGSIIIYSFLQAIGVVNDHEVDCFRCCL